MGTARLPGNVAFGLGLILMVAGALWGFSALGRDTTVLSQPEKTVFGVTLPAERIHNTGLVAQRQADLTAAAATGIIGTILLAAGLLSEAIERLAVGSPRQKPASGPPPIR